MIETCLRVARACLPWNAAASMRADCAALAEVPLAPPPGSPLSAAIAAVEASEFVRRDEAHAIERFGLLMLALDSAISRDRSALAAVETIEGQSRGNGRTQGTEWAYEQLFLDTDRLRQIRELLHALAPHERAIRALIVGEHAAREA